MAYNSKRTPTNGTGCGNHNCDLKGDCTRYTKGASATRVNVFRPERRHGNALSCLYQIPKKPKKKAA